MTKAYTIQPESRVSRPVPRLVARAWRRSRRLVFVLGMTTGAVLAWLWGREIEGYVGAQTRDVHARAAEGMRVVDETAGHVLDRGGDSLRRAEGFLQETKAHVSEALRAGREAIRPA